MRVLGKSSNGPNPHGLELPEEEVSSILATLTPKRVES